MRTLTSTLLASQKARQLEPYFRLTFSKTGESDVVIEQDRILDASGVETSESQRASFIFQNSTGYFTSLDLKGWQVVIERGLKTTTGVEYDSMPAMKVVPSNLASSPGHLRAGMSFIGILDLLNLDKASKDYVNHWSCTKTVKSLFTEIASGQPVDTELTEEQTEVTGNDAIMLYGASNGVAGVAVTISNRTVTKLSFRVSKLGTPGGNVTFKVSQDAGGSTLASKTVATSAIGYTWGWIEATLDTPLVVNERVWLTCEYSGGDISNYVLVNIYSAKVNDDEPLIFQGTGGAGPDWEDASRTCAYRYKYTGGTGETNGIDCFDHCTAYTVVYDSEDSLIDTYVPAGGFSIPHGSTRLQALKALQRYTSCVKRIQADGKIHVFVPTTSGVVYDYQYELDNRILIDLGSEATNRSTVYPLGFTLVDLANPANASGVLTSIEVWAATTIAGFRVGTFYLVSGTTYKCRDSVTLGAVTAGSKQTFSTRLTVVAGDFIGCHWDSGTLEADDTGGSGVIFSAGEHIDAGDSLTGTLGVGDAISLKATRIASHEFFSKSIRNALVIPNRITVHSYPSDADQYTGSATDATSYALLPIDDFIRAKLTSNAQASSIATAMIAQEQMNSQRGSGTVPMNLGAEIYDYVKITDSWESDSRAGNLGYIKWQYKPGFDMAFSFGHLIPTTIGGWQHHRRELVYHPDKDDIVKELDYQDVEFTAVDENLQDIDNRVKKLEDTALASDQITEAQKGYLKKLEEDPAPKLGADLDLNGKNIDFPTTPNISDCLDEDNMASNSATKLATQQSIKAYADTKLANVVEDTTPQLGGDLDANGKKITGVDDIIPQSDNHSLLGDSTHSINRMDIHFIDVREAISMHNVPITTLPTPTQDDYAANKAYVDGRTTLLASDLGAVNLTAALFQSYTATGDCTNPANINDNNTGTYALWANINLYTEIDFAGAFYFISQFRHYGTVDCDGNGIWKIQYKSILGVWVDWVTNISLRNLASWSGWNTSGGQRVCAGIRIVATSLDSGSHRMPEIEIKL